MRRKILTAVLGFGLAGVLGLQTAHAEAVVGQPAPAFVARTLEGKNFDLAALKGKVVVLHFWATWCVPCQQEMPALEAVWRSYRSKGLEVLSISADRPRARASVAQVMHYFSYPAAMLDEVSKNDFGAVANVPLAYVIGKDGNVADILMPPLTTLNEGALGDEVKALLDAKYEAKTETKPAEKDETKVEAKP